MLSVQIERYTVDHDLNNCKINNDENTNGS